MSKPIPSSMLRRIVGIGDLHLDGGLAPYLEDANEVVIDEVRTIIQDNLPKGFRTFALLGDLFDSEVPRWSPTQNGYELLFRLFAEFPQCLFLVVGGNHDTDTTDPEGCHSLSLMQTMYDLGMFKNVVVAARDPLVIGDGDERVKLLPWPHLDTEADCLNIVHNEYHGSVRDNGRAVEEGTKVPKGHLILGGHLHTKQKVGSFYCPGTVYQTTFGEQPDKFYARVGWTGDVATSKVVFVPHAPRFTLKNAVINSLEEYEAFCDMAREAGDMTLFKVFVNSRSVLLPVNAFAGLTNVVKTNPFQTETELTAVMQDELGLEGCDAHHIEVGDALQDWMNRNDIQPELQRRSHDMLARLFNQDQPQGPSDE